VIHLAAKDLKRTECISLVQRFGVGSSGSDIRITSRLVRTSGKLQLVSCLEIGIAGLAVSTGVIFKIKELANHSCEKTLSETLRISRYTLDKLEVSRLNRNPT
jgi:hypothetical protein